MYKTDSELNVCLAELNSLSKNNKNREIYLKKVGNSLVLFESSLEEALTVTQQRIAEENGQTSCTENKP